MKGGGWATRLTESSAMRDGQENSPAPRRLVVPANESESPAPRVSQGLPAGVPTIPESSKRPQCNNTARLQSQRHADGKRALTRWILADSDT